MQNSAGLGSVFIIQPVYHKNMRKNGLNNRHGDFSESGISACPESVGVGKFCRLRLRLRLREKQPTPTDSDYGSDSDSAALPAGACHITADSKQLPDAGSVVMKYCLSIKDMFFFLLRLNVRKYMGYYPYRHSKNITSVLTRFLWCQMTPMTHLKVF